MKKVYLDIGAYDGDTVAYFRSHVENANEYEIHCFEANSALWHHFDGLGVTLHRKAVWISDGQVDFYIGGFDVGSTMMKGKKSGSVDYRHPVKIESVNLDRWIKENFTVEDYIIMKMDIEGAEFEILPHMIQGGSFAFLNQLWVELHPNKVPKYTTKDKNNLIDRIRSYPELKFMEWH